MTTQLGFLTSPSPVMLEPALRLFEPRARESSGERLLPERPGSRVLLTFSATGALYQAAVALGLGRGDTVLIPAYNCGHEVEPFLRTGARVRFYRVRSDLAIDTEDLLAGIDASTRAVLVTHYFGFPQHIDTLRSICDARGLVLIEDCAHALLSRRGAEPLGTVGDVAVFSLRKTLPLPHGGALVCHDPAIELPPELPAPPRLSTWVKLLERYQKGWLMPHGGGPRAVGRAAFLATRLLVDVARSARTIAAACGRPQFDPDDESFDFPLEPLRTGMAPQAVAVLKAARAQQIVDVRRRNFEALLAASSGFDGCVPVFRELPAGVCPLYFPVRAERSEELVVRLQRAGISAVEWWSIRHDAVPWDAFPEASSLKDEVVAIPIHQDLGRPHLERIIEVLRAQVT